MDWIVISTCNILKTITDQCCHNTQDRAMNGNYLPI